MANNRNIVVKSETQTGAGQSEPIFLLANISQDALQKYVVTLINTSDGTAKVESTDEPEATIGSATWVEFGVGDVALTAGQAVQDATQFPISAFRINATSGNWKLNIRGDLE